MEILTLFWKLKPYEKIIVVKEIEKRKDKNKGGYFFGTWRDFQILPLCLNS